MTAYGAHDRIVATLTLLRWYRAFEASDCEQAADPLQPRYCDSRIRRSDVPTIRKQLVDSAINRKAGMPDCPDHRFASCPLNHRGRPMRHAVGDAQRHLRQLAHEINSRVIVRRQRLGEWASWLAQRLPGRFETEAD